MQHSFLQQIQSCPSTLDEHVLRIKSEWIERREVVRRKLHRVVDHGLEGFGEELEECEEHALARELGAEDGSEARVASDLLMEGGEDRGD